MNLVARATWRSIATRGLVLYRRLAREIVRPFCHGRAHLPRVYSEDLAEARQKCLLVPGMAGQICSRELADYPPRG